MYCSNCGKEIKEDSKFCSYCGYNLEKLTVSETKTNIDNEQFNFFYTQTEKLKKILKINSNGILIFWVLILYPIAIPFLLFWYTIPYLKSGKNKRKNIVVFLLIALFILAGIFGPRENNKKNNTNENSAINSKQIVKTEKQNNQQIHKAPIDNGAVWELPTQKGQGYDKTIIKYGVAGIKKINSLTPKVAEKISYNTSCDRVINVDVSDNRSTKDTLIFYADCKNGQRFYLTELEALSKTPIQSEKELLAEKLAEQQLICENAIKSQLYHPSTYKKLFTKSSAETKQLINDIVIGFKAKNSLGLELEYECRCFINSRDQITLFNIQEK